MSTNKTVTIWVVTLVILFILVAIAWICVLVYQNKPPSYTISLVTPFVFPTLSPVPFASSPAPFTASSLSESNFMTAVWSGGSTDWQDLLGKVNYIFLATALPQEMTPNMQEKYGGAFLHIDASPSLHFTPSIIGSQNVLLSIGGSVATVAGWLAMAQFPIAQWVSYFQALKTTFGIGGIDWDIEPDSLYGTGTDPNTVCTFIGDLNRALKAADPAYQISVTVFGNAVKFTKGQSAASLLENYIDSIDVIPIMLYNGGMWRKSTYGSWCQYAQDFFNLFSTAVQNKILYAIWMASQSKANADCCGSCIAEVLTRVQSGAGAGIAFWCYGGYNGACSNYKPVNLAVLDQLRATGVDTTEAQLQQVILANAPYDTNPEYCLVDGCGNT